MKSSLELLPPNTDLESKAILKKVSSANKHLAELKGILNGIPTPNKEILEEILTNTIYLQEAKDSSAIENIITSQDELFKDGLFKETVINPATKEVRNYESALKLGFNLINKNQILTNNTIIAIQSNIEQSGSGFRTLPGTVLKNAYGEIIYKPPQDQEEIINLMINLEKFINEDELYEVDPLVKMAIIHYQFESIHPFYDGNGRTGRIINVLYLVLKDLLPLPILYLSRYIVQTKSKYYMLLQKIRTDNAWEDWILYILEGIESTSKQTIKMIQDIQNAYMNYQNIIQSKHKFYSQDLIKNLFMYPYTKIEYLMNVLNVSRITATNYLETLSNDKLLKKEKAGKYNYYINVALLNILNKSS